MSKSLYDRQWRKRRELQLAEHPLCRLCMDVRGIVRVATIVDHITPHRGDPELFDGPVQSLCKSCHDSWKQQWEKSGRIKGCDSRGVPLDPNHPWRKEAYAKR